MRMNNEIAQTLTQINMASIGLLQSKERFAAMAFSHYIRALNFKLRLLGVK